jgi:hypothetical protein
VNPDIERLLATRPETAALARRACEVVLELLPGAVISVDDENAGFGTAAGYRGLVFVVAPHRAHVTLGIARGAGLPDPAGLMEGTGRVHRHVKLRTGADLDRPELRALMRAAIVA